MSTVSAVEALVVREASASSSSLALSWCATGVLLHLGDDETRQLHRALNAFPTCAPSRAHVPPVVIATPMKIAV